MFDYIATKDIENAELKNAIKDRANIIRKRDIQIEKMKCCQNCKNVHYAWREQVRVGICNECRNYNKWELAEC